MKRRWKLWTALVLLPLVLGVGGVMLHTRDTEPERAYERIKLGMTLDEVEDAIGPAGIQGSVVGALRVLRQTGRSWQNTNLASDLRWTRVWWWDDHSCFIEVVFDEGLNRAVGYYLLEVNEHSSFLEKVRRSLRLRQ